MVRLVVAALVLVQQVQLVLRLALAEGSRRELALLVRQGVVPEWWLVLDACRRQLVVGRMMRRQQVRRLRLHGRSGRHLQSRPVT